MEQVWVRSQSRVGDGESARLRVLDTRSQFDKGIHASGAVALLRSGKDIAMDTPTARELAATRSRRARVAAQAAAAAKRRLLLTAVLLVAVGVVAACAGSGLVHWGWVAIPGAALAGVLGLGARAAAQGRKNDRQMLERIARLKREARSGDHSLTPRPKVDLSLSGATRAPKAPSGKGIEVAHARHQPERHSDALTPAADQAQPRDGAQAEEPAAVAAAPASGESAPRRARIASVSDADEGLAQLHVDATARARVNRQLDAQRDPVRGVVAEGAAADPFAKPWTPMPLPKPTYAMKPMLQRRDVDTQALIAQQRAQVREGVPYRPTSPATPQGVPLTSAQVAGTGAISLDVDDVLNRRRLG